MPGDVCADCGVVMCLHPGGQDTQGGGSSDEDG